MNKIEEYIRNIYSELQADEKQPISETSIRDAIRYIDAFNLKDSNDLFVVLAALNLLSANAKNGKLKTTLYYSYIKSNVGKVAEHVITHEKDFKTFCGTFLCLSFLCFRSFCRAGYFCIGFAGWICGNGWYS